MPKLTIDGVGEFEVEAGTRLVLALVDNGGDVLHRCGGNARCTTCRIEYLSGESARWTVAEHDKLAEKKNIGKFRLSCQALIEHDVHVRPLMKFGESGLPDRGSRPEDRITPEPEWITTPLET